jgi:3-oxoacyl-[acyl-carrier-protein] synthase-3
MRAHITGTGLYAPERVVDNAYFDRLYDQDVDTFLRTRRGIKERRYAAEGQATSDLVVEAARHALERAGRTAAEVDLIVVATDTPDYLSPSTAAIVQHKLGADRAGSFDLNTACAGFVTALDVARRYVQSEPDRYRVVLVAGAYLMSRFIDFRHRNTATLFADGAGVVVLEPGDDGYGGILTSELETQGQYAEHMGIYVGGAARPADAEAVADQEHLLQFRQKFPATFNRENWSALVRLLSERTGVAPGEVDRYFFTQINLESIHETLDALDVPYDRAHNVMERYGYTGSACVPMALADAASRGVLKAGDTLFLVASGGGAALAAMALRWTYDT